MKSTKRAAWSDVKASLNDFDRVGLLGVIRNLYEANAANRRFLHARFVPAAWALESIEIWFRPRCFHRHSVNVRSACAKHQRQSPSTGARPATSAASWTCY
jgi:hypothetical protein